MTERLDHRSLYRLPWSLPDNAISWLEPTAACNLYCEGCYRTNDPRSHKGLDQVADELDVFTRLRTTDGISVAGGDPLCHPEVVEIVAMIAERGLKPILNTNGLALTREWLTEMRRAGLWGLTLHIDSKQRRPHWRGKSEVELNELRLEYAQLIDGAFDYYVNGKRIELDDIRYAADGQPRVDISSTDILATIQQRFPDFRPCAYLNGTEKPDSFKWLLTGRLGTKGRVHGYVGPRFMELAQASHHLRHGRYLAYSSPRAHRCGRSILATAVLDRGVARAGVAYLRNPLRLFRRLHYQSVMIIQPVDVLPDGRQNMCDGCPDMTVWNGRLAWSCRLEEPMNLGDFVQTVPKRPPASQ